MPNLVLIVGPEQTKQVTLQPHETRIGRASSNDLVLDMNRVGRVHALNMVETAFVSITDLGSKNGTFVNGAKISEKTFLANGDSIRIGDCDMRFLSGDQHYTQIDALRLLTVPGLLIEIDRRASPMGGAPKA